jgi:Toastrack DUF4097
MWTERNDHDNSEPRMPNMKHAIRMTMIALLGSLLAAGTAQAQDFNWRGRIASGRELEIKGINGDIHAVASSGNEVRVSAVKSGRKSNPDDVEVKVIEHDDGITICAVYPAARRAEPNECRHGTGGRMNVRDNDVRVDFTIEVPAGVVLVARTVNGKVVADDLASDIRAYSVNGAIDVSTSGIAEARTVNGAIHARFNNTNWTSDLEFETVNGGITLEVGDDLNADVRAATVNGGISTDFPLTVQGRFGPKRISGTIGRGGRTLALSTVNGSIEIRRR